MRSRTVPLRILILLYFSTWLTGFSCGRHSGAFSEVDMPNNTLIISSGGGFTGRETVYLLTFQGKVFKKVAEKYVFMGKMDLNKAKQAFTLYDAQKLDELQVDDPGNMYYTIDRHQNGHRHRLVWGKTPEKHEILYKYHRFLWKEIEKLNLIN